MGYKSSHVTTRRFILNTHRKAIHKTDRKRREDVTPRLGITRMFAVQATTRIGTHIFATRARERFTFFSCVFHTRARTGGDSRRGGRRARRTHAGGASRMGGRDRRG